MDIKTIDISEVKPYERNPRNNDNTVDYVAESIKQFGFKVPIIIDGELNKGIGRVLNGADALSKIIDWGVKK